MEFSRRELLQVIGGALAAPVTAGAAWAQAYPSRVVRLISPFPAGGPSDTIGRLIGQWLSERLGQPFIIDNRPGAAGTLGSESVARSAPDGYTLLMVGPANMIGATVYEKAGFKFVRDIAPVAGVMRVPNILEVHPSVPVKSVPELIAYAKANPGKLNMASAGTGSASYAAGKLFCMMTGINMTHVPYRGAAPALLDLIEGQVQVLFDVVPNSIEYVKSGKLRPLAITTATRFDKLPDLPTVSEFVPGYEASSVYGIGAPRNTPADIIERLNKEIDAGLNDSKLRERLADLGGKVLVMSPADFGNLIVTETDKWAKVMMAKSANLN
jgi:tripartite-type tricarboxylate transporter receptor subunit TctC